MLANAYKCWQLLANAGKCWQMLVNTCKCWQVLVRCLKCLLAQQPLTNSVNRSPTCSNHHAKGLCDLQLDCMLMIVDNLGHQHSINIVSTICCTATHFTLMPPQTKRPPHRWHLWDVNSHVLAMRVPHRGLSLDTVHKAAQAKGGTGQGGCCDLD